MLGYAGYWWSERNLLSSLLRFSWFPAAVQQRIGPSKCLCTQTQHARLHPGNHLIFETSQIMDIP